LRPFDILGVVSAAKRGIERIGSERRIVSNGVKVERKCLV
jgi:hypothetical protein